MRQVAAIGLVAIGCAAVVGGLMVMRDRYDRRLKRLYEGRWEQYDSGPLEVSVFITRPVPRDIVPLEDEEAFDAEWAEIASRLRHPTGRDDRP